MLNIFFLKILSCAFPSMEGFSLVCPKGPESLRGLLLDCDTTENGRRLLPLHGFTHRQLFLCFCFQQIKKLQLSAIQLEFPRLRYVLNILRKCLASVAPCGEAALSSVRMKNWTLLLPLTSLLFKDKKPLIGR